MIDSYAADQGKNERCVGTSGSGLGDDRGSVAIVSSLDQGFTPLQHISIRDRPTRLSECERRIDAVS